MRTITLPRALRTSRDEDEPECGGSPAVVIGKERGRRRSKHFRRGFRRVVVAATDEGPAEGPFSGGVRKEVTLNEFGPLLQYLGMYFK